MWDMLTVKLKLPLLSVVTLRSFPSTYTFMLLFGRPKPSSSVKMPATFIFEPTQASPLSTHILSFVLVIPLTCFSSTSPDNVLS